MAYALGPRRIVPVLLLFCLLACTRNAYATASLLFQGYVQTLNTVGSITLSSPSGIVVDSAGDIFIADTVSGSGRIVEVNAQGTASVLAVSGLSPALGSLSAIAIDRSGNLYIVDTGNTRVVKVGLSGAGSVISTGSVTLTAPHGVALDQSGDLFISDGTGEGSRIVEVTAGGSAAALTIDVSSGAGSLNSPEGLAVDVSGKLYIADSANNRIVTVASGSTTGVVLNVELSPALSNPSGVAVDRVGNVLIADTRNNRIVEVGTSGLATDLSNFLSSELPLNAPLGVAVDAFGAVYIANTSNSSTVIVDPASDWDPASEAYGSSLNKTAVGFGHISLGSSTPTSRVLNFIVGNPVLGLGSVNALTSGTQGLDFQVANTTCSSSSVAGDSCTVQVNFLPTAPGLRRGALVLYDPDSNPVLTVPLYGFGDAPIAALNPNTGTVISTGTLTLNNPYQVALDGAGNMYVASYSGSNVTRIPAGSGSATVVSLGTPASTAVQNITGIAVDGAGNLFIGDHQNSRILVVTPGGVVSVLNISGLSSALGFPTALAFDAAGNLYIADFTNGQIVEVSSLMVSGSTATGKGTVLNTGGYSFTGSTLTGLTIDSQGTIYAAARTDNNSSIIKLTAAGVASEVAIPNNITPAISDPQGVAADAMGNLYIVDSGNSRIVKITTAGVASVLSLSGLTNPSSLGSLLFGVTVDPFGNLYIPDWSNNRLVFVNVSGSSFTYASTKQGLTSSDSPMTATVTNLGNQPLVFSANPTYTASFSSNGNDTNPCTSSTSLLPGTLCDVSVNFTPQSVGSLSAPITVTNNALNVAGSTQSVSVSGTGQTAGDTTKTALTISPTALVSGQPVTLTATVSDTATGNAPTGTVSFTDTVGSTVTTLNNGSPVSLSNETASLAGVVLSGVGTHTIAANYAGVSEQYLSSTNSITLVLSKASVTVTGPATQPISTTPGQTGSATITVTAPYTTIAAPSGTVSYTILNASGTIAASGTLTLASGSGNATATVPLPSTLAPGSYTISVTYNGDGNYAAAATPTTIALQVSQITPTIALTSSASSVVLTNPLLFTATVASTATTPTGTVSFLDGTTPLGQGTLSNGVATLSVSSLTAGNHTITALYSGDVNYRATVSAALTETVVDFSLNNVGGSSSGGSTGSNSPQTVLPGGTATYPLSILPTNGTIFPAPITLSVTGLPDGATATISPSSWTQLSSTTWSIPANIALPSTTLAIQTPSTVARLEDARKLPPVLWGLLLLPFISRRRRLGRKLGRTISLLLLLAAGAAAMAGLSGCSAGNGFFAQSEKTYTITVTATSGTLSHATTINLTLE